MHNGVGLNGEVLAAFVALERSGLAGRASGDVGGLSERAKDAVGPVGFYEHPVGTSSSEKCLIASRSDRSLSITALSRMCYSWGCQLLNA